MTNQNPLLLRWTSMCDRERAVWAASFAVSDQPAEQAARLADARVDELRLLLIDATQPGPEYRLARAGIGIDLATFAVWYGVEAMMMYGSQWGWRPPTEQDIAGAFENYDRGRADFY